MVMKIFETNYIKLQNVVCLMNLDSSVVKKGREKWPTLLCDYIVLYVLKQPSSSSSSSSMRQALLHNSPLPND